MGFLRNGQLVYYPTKLSPERSEVRRLISLTLFHNDKPEALVEAGKILSALARRRVQVASGPVNPDPSLLLILDAAVHDGCRRGTAQGVARPRPGTRVHSLDECDEFMRRINLDQALELMRTIGNRLERTPRRQ